VHVTKRDGSLFGAGLGVHAFSNNVEIAGALTDATGTATLSLPAGNYRFGAQFDGHGFTTSGGHDSGLHDLRIAAPYTSISVDDLQARTWLFHK
jgi:hypothetical protein